MRLICVRQSSFRAAFLFVERPAATNCPTKNFNYEVFRIGRDSTKSPMINGQIRDKEVRLIGADGEQLGIVPIAEAQQKADSANLDLVLIAPQAKPPVCKIIDYGKYRFETVKKEREHRKNQKIMVIKEIRLSSNIDEHDFMVKVNHAIKFLKEGDKVKTSIRFRGREITHAQLGQQCLERFGEKVSEFGVVEKRPKLEGRSMTMFIAPITKEGSR